MLKNKDDMFVSHVLGSLVAGRERLQAHGLCRAVVPRLPRTFAIVIREPTEPPDLIIRLVFKNREQNSREEKHMAASH